MNEQSEQRLITVATAVALGLLLLPIAATMVGLSIRALQWLVIP